jgi:predicted N-acetyltransferase YhbS
LSQAVWQERLASRHHDQSLLLGAFDDGELIGIAYAKVAASPWQSRDTGWLALLCVEPGWQGTGVGTRLAAAAVRSLRARGCSQLRFGSDADHFLPGLPQEACAAAWRLARRLGGVPTNAEHDLLLDLRTTLPPAPLPPGFRLRDDRPESGLAFVTAAFPGRWAEELGDYIAGGATVITIERDGADDASDQAPAQGFCMVFQGSERVTSPGLLWREALVAELGPRSPRLAGIGPLGVAPDVRGAGAGLALVRGAAAWLQDRGHTDAVINWTTLTGFYGRLGARVWRTYQRVNANLSVFDDRADGADGMATDAVARDGDPASRAS